MTAFFILGFIGVVAEKETLQSSVRPIARERIQAQKNGGGGGSGAPASESESESKSEE